MILSLVRALISAFKARRELVLADELNRRHTHRKRGETDRPRLRSTALALDPTGHDVARDLGCAPP